MSSTLSAAESAAPAPAGAAGPRSRPHVIAFDLIRLIIMVFVVSVHTLAFAGGTVTMSIGAVTTVFHTSRELFLLLTALVLTYNYGQRPLQGRPVLAAPLLARAARLRHLVRDLLRGRRAVPGRVPVRVPA